jgi:RNAse III (EC 3.1.26.3)
MSGNAFEALVGAIYMDRGYNVCKHFIEEKIIKRFIDLDKVAKKEVNFKSKLIEWTQKNKVTASFELIEQFLDKESNPIFQSEILIEGLSAGTGIGYSKKESQQNAAKMALKKIQTTPNFLKEIFDEAKKKAEAAMAEKDILAKDDENSGIATLETEATEIETEITDSFEPENNEMILKEEQEANISVTEQLIPNNPLLG